MNRENLGQRWVAFQTRAQRVAFPGDLVQQLRTMVAAVLRRTEPGAHEPRENPAARHSSTQGQGKPLPPETKTRLETRAR